MDDNSTDVSTLGVLQSIQFYAQGIGQSPEAKEESQGKRQRWSGTRPDDVSDPRKSDVSLAVLLTLIQPVLTKNPSTVFNEIVAAEAAAIGATSRNVDLYVTAVEEQRTNDMLSMGYIGIIRWNYRRAMMGLCGN